MSRADTQLLFELLQEVRSLVAQPSNDFLWSPWDGPEDALREIDGLRSQLADGAVPARALKALFAPTGSLQELSASSGWGHEFLQLAERFDTLIG
jgi:hypothetical protein